MDPAVNHISGLSCSLSLCHLHVRESLKGIPTHQHVPSLKQPTLPALMVMSPERKPIVSPQQWPHTSYWLSQCFILKNFKWLRGHRESPTFLTNSKGLQWGESWWRPTAIITNSIMRAAVWLMNGGAGTHTPSDQSNEQLWAAGVGVSRGNLEASHLEKPMRRWLRGALFSASTQMSVL